MGYMARADRVARRRDPSLILPGVQSVVMVGLPYWPGASKFPAAHAVPPPPDGAVKAGKVTEQTGAADTNSGVVSSYAWGGDYHAILDARLRSLGEWLVDRAGGTARYYADTGAVLERDFAARARMGFIGKNSLLIHPQLGSGVFLGALLTTTALPVDGDEEEPPRKGKPGCGKCTKCMDFCPTRAIVSDRVVDARRCISYLTIELAGSIPEALRRGMGARVYGCDICQQVCPWNRLEWSGDGPLWSEVGKEVSTPSLVGLLEMDEKGFRERFKGSAIARIGRDRLARNAAVALGNVGGRGEMARVEEAAEGHASELVREHARWAVGEIRARVRVGGDDRSSAGDDAF